MTALVDIKKVLPATVDSKLDDFLVQVFLEAYGIAEARHCFYGIRHHFVLTNQLLRLSHLSLRRFGRQRKAGMEDPVTWESVLLTALALLDFGLQVVGTRLERISAAIGQLLGFDLYCRGGDMPMLQREDLRRPVPRQKGAARHWSATFFPKRLSITAKNQEMDVCKTIGSTHPD